MKRPDILNANKDKDILKANEENGTTAIPSEATPDNGIIERIKYIPYEIGARTSTGRLSKSFAWGMAIGIALLLFGYTKSKRVRKMVHNVAGVKV